MRNGLLSGAVIFALVLAALPIGARQTATDSISGTVKDPADAAIVGAQVSIRSDTTGEVRSTLTNNEGRFKFDNLAPGSYTISVSQTGFKPVERSAVIGPARPAAIEIRLEVAAPREKVEVGAKGAVAPNSEPNYFDGNKRMDWFFNQWVYGTELPRYKLGYALTTEADGKVMLKFTVMQSGVSERFKMLVPVYLDFDGKLTRLGEVTLIGNTTTPEFKVRLPQRPKRVVLNAFHDILALESVSEQR